MVMHSLAYTIVSDGRFASPWESENILVFFFQAEDGIRYTSVTGVQTCALPIYDLPLERKIEVIATQVYGAAQVRLQPAAAQKLARWQTMGHGRLPVCMAKTQNSLSDDPKKTGRPRGFTLTVRDARLCAGAGFVVAYAGDVLTMPGLPKVPGAEGMDVDATGHVTGLF